MPGPVAESGSSRPGDPQSNFRFPPDSNHYGQGPAGGANGVSNGNLDVEGRYSAEDRSGRSRDNELDAPGQSRSRSRPANAKRMCKKCGEPLTGQFVRALGGTFHLDCFKCRVRDFSRMCTNDVNITGRTAATLWPRNSSQWIMRTVQVSILFAKPTISVDLTCSAIHVVGLCEAHILPHWIGNIILSILLVPYAQPSLVHRTATTNMTAKYIAIITTQRNLHSAAMDVKQRF